MRLLFLMLAIAPQYGKAEVGGKHHDELVCLTSLLRLEAQLDFASQ